MVKSLAHTQGLQPGQVVRLRWAASDACVYTEWNDADLTKAAAH